MSYLQRLSLKSLCLFQMLASKFLFDEGIDEEIFNDEWAKSADMEVEDLNRLEREFLEAIVSKY